jgi:hypothetical protein
MAGVEERSGVGHCPRYGFALLFSVDDFDPVGEGRIKEFTERCFVIWSLELEVKS